MNISVIIVSYNTKELLRNCLSSLRSGLASEREYHENAGEVIVVDNNSRDGSAEMVRREFPEAKLIVSSENLGFSRANNKGLKEAGGEYLLFLNPDTTVPPETLPAMLKFMEENPKVGVSTCRVEFRNGKLDWDCHRGWPTPWASLTRFLGFYKIFPRSGIFNRYYLGWLPVDKVHEIDSAAGAFMLTRRKVLNQIGGWDEDFFFYGEDIDLCWRVKKAGWKVVFYPHVRIFHYKGASSGIKKSSWGVTKATRESRDRALRASTEAMKIFYDKHLKGEYPFFVDIFVYLGVSCLRQMRLLSNRLRR